MSRLHSRASCGFDEGVAELASSLFHGSDDSIVVCLDVVIGARIDVGSLILDREVDHSRELVCRRIDGLLRSEVSTLAAVERAER